MLDVIVTIGLSSLCLAGLITGYLIFSSLKHHTRTGPRVKETIEQYYRGYATYALLRLAICSALIVFSLSAFGSLLYFFLSLLVNNSFSLWSSTVAGLIFTLFITSYLFCHHLFYTPSLILVSTQIRFSRLDPLWRQLSPGRLRTVRWAAYSLVGILLFFVHLNFHTHDYFPSLLVLDSLVLITVVLLSWLSNKGSKPTTRSSTHHSQNAGSKSGTSTSDISTPDTSTQANVLMIGTDTLRADRLGVSGYHRELTPEIDKLAKRGFYFRNCYVPLARTAPSLASILTGCWPHNHKIRSNYPSASELDLPVPNIAALLGDAGYNTAAVGDWAAADLGKLAFGFQETRLPKDQWNLKYLIKQGSAFIRLFLSLFAHNRLGKKLLPEIYYLAGIPLSQQTGNECRDLISKYSADSKPFFINYFSAAAHVPFGSDYPYHNLFTEAGYEGESRFLMTSLASPEEIIEKQGLSTEDFDVPQIINLYDGCIRQFDDEVGKILDHLARCGQSDNTIVIIYSDHGADFFENGCWGQGNTLMGDDPSNRIPLIIYDPAQEGGKTFNETVRSIDVAPTLLDLLGIKPIPTVDGMSLKPWLKTPDIAHEQLSYHETGVWLGKIPGMREDHLTYPDLLEIMDIPDKRLAMLSLKQAYYADIIEAKDRSIRDGKWKMIFFPTIHGLDYQLFDMSNDPQCRINVAAEFPEVFSQYKQLLDEWIYSDPLMSSTS